VKHHLVGHSKVFLDLLARAEKFSKFDYPVLIYGETGVGKELFARYIHEHSPRAKAPFLPVNCGALPAGLFESELFGYVRGAFSGALQNTRGLVRSADSGTLFLDEVADLELPLQVKLLRLLDSGEVRPVGSARLEFVDVRIVAATNIDLGNALREERFRRDLLERLSVLLLRVPPLRERREDIALLSKNYIASLGSTCDDDSIRLLEEYEWPGNIRQLRNVLTRASVLSNLRISALTVRQILEEAVDTSSYRPPDGICSLAEIEKRAIVDRLRACQGNRKRAAEELGIAKSTLHEKLRKWRKNTSSTNVDVSSDNGLHR
jgi:two-component system NtrC family response regulator